MTAHWPGWNDLLDLADKVVEHQQRESAKLASMTPAEREAYIREWADGVAAATVPVDTAYDAQSAGDKAC